MVGVYALLTTFLLVVLLPLLYIVASSFSDPLAVSSGRVTFWPVDFTLLGYQKALSDDSIITGFTNSLIYTVAGTAISLVLTVAIAYPLSRRDFWGRRGITLFVVFTMLFAGGIIPTYLVVQNLGLLDTRWALILPQAVGVWQVIIAVAFFRTSIPDELYEAAQLDGASDLRFLFSTVIPLSKPLLAVIALMYAIYQWNSYFDALLYLRRRGPLSASARVAERADPQPGSPWHGCRGRHGAPAARQPAQVFAHRHLHGAGDARVPLRRPILQQGNPGGRRQGVVRPQPSQYPTKCPNHRKARP